MTTTAATAREQIIRTTCELMERQGYHATGLNQIIKESGSPKGSLYHYFPNGKEALAVEALQHVGQIVLKRIREQLAQTPDPAKAISGFILNVAHNVVRSGYSAGGPITTVALETASTNEALRQACEAIYAGWEQAFADKLIDGGGDVGGIDETRAVALAALIVAALEGGILLARTRQTPEPLEQIAAQVERLIALG